MEDILASIRRIISDEVASASRESSPNAAPAVAQLEPAQVEPVQVEPVQAETPPVEAERVAPELPPFVSRYSQSRVEARSVEPARERPAAPSAYAPVGRVPAADPFVPRRSSALPASPAATRSLAARAEPVFTPPAPRPSLVRAGSAQAAAQAVIPQREDLEAEAVAPETLAHEAVMHEAMAADPDARLAAALLDIDLVEQAVQAELATMSADPALDAATADHDETQAMMAAEPENVTSPVAAAFAAEPMPVEASSGLPAVDDVLSAIATSGPDMSSLPVTPREVENAPMQATAKPFQAARAAASELDERRAEPRHEPRFLSARPAAAPAAEMPAAAPQPAPSEGVTAAPQGLISGSTNHAVSAAFGSLARTVASNSRTVDDLVTEALRPMLKEWLDENLPALVERLVRAEIERVSRQGQ